MKKWLKVAVILMATLFIGNYLKNLWWPPYFTEYATTTEGQHPIWKEMKMRKNAIGTLYSDDRDAQICLEAPQKDKNGDCVCDDPYYIRESVNLGNRNPRTIYYTSKKDVHIYY